MESADLNRTPPDDRELETWLRTNCALPPLHDDGFSQRVIAALPPPPKRRFSRMSVCLLGTLAGSGVALVAWARGATSSGLPALEEAAQHSWHPLAIPFALGLAALSTWFAFRDRLRALTGRWL